MEPSNREQSENTETLIVAPIESIPAPSAKGYESLNFDKVLSQLWMLKGVTGKKMVKVPGVYDKDGNPFMTVQAKGRLKSRVIVTVLIGICTGLISYGITKAVAWLTDRRYDAVKAVYNESPAAGVALFIVWNLSLALVASLLVVYVAPGARGSGIPEVKAYLNGVNVSARLASIPR